MHICNLFSSERRARSTQAARITPNVATALPRSNDSGAGGGGSVDACQHFVQRIACLQATLAMID